VGGGGGGVEPSNPPPHCTPLHGRYIYFAGDKIVMNFIVFFPLCITYFCGFSGIEMKKIVLNK